LRISRGDHDKKYQKKKSGIYIPTKLEEAKQLVIKEGIDQRNFS
jgi:hypothetical protein